MRDQLIVTSAVEFHGQNSVVKWYNTHTYADKTPRMVNLNLDVTSIALISDNCDVDLQVCWPELYDADRRASDPEVMKQASELYIA